MESPRKFNDCYFYYYSTCTKGDNCVFRHEPSALGCETMCSAWQQGKCLDKRCKLRHMELRKNRKQIPCYWENQPGGCRKMHCPFMHKNPEARTDGIAPSQPSLPTLGQSMGMPDNMVLEQSQVTGGMNPGMGGGPPVPTAVPAPVPLLWQQQRQVVLDSAILGVQLSASPDLRRVLTPHGHGHGHAHAHAHPHVHEPGPPNPYAPLPVDPLVVNFEEESDNESAPSSTPTKTASSGDAQRVAQTKSQELLLLERIQAESAAFYSYDTLPPEPPKERGIVKTNLSSKYDRLSLDEISGKTQQVTEGRNSLDFKVLSLDEIRARKKDRIIHGKPISLNLSRKRKLSTQETMTTSGNKIIKVVRSNSIVYKKVDRDTPVVSAQSKEDHKSSEDVSRKRTLSELSDLYAEIEDELDSSCNEFKKVKLVEQTSIPKLIRNRLYSLNKTNEIDIGCNIDNDSDSEVQIISIDKTDRHVDLSIFPDSDIIDVENVRLGDQIDIVDLSDDLDESDVTIGSIELGLDKNVPDVVASCQQSVHRVDSDYKSLIRNIESLISSELNEI